MASPFSQKNAAWLSTVVVLVLLLAIVGLYFTHSLLGHGPLAIGLQVAAILLMLWARVTFGLRSFHYAANPTEGGLVTTGPYRWARHPIYTVYLLINTGILLRHFTLPFAGVLALWLGTLFLRVRYEESVLAGAFPEYPDYRRRVRAFGIIG